MMTGGKYREPLPKGCPCVAAVNANGSSGWRLLAKARPDNACFDSQFFRFPARYANYVGDRRCCAMSVSLVPTSRLPDLAANMRYAWATHAVCVTIPPGGGKILVDAKGHIDWWPLVGTNVLSLLGPIVEMKDVG
jgi:hypothetical protein